MTQAEGELSSGLGIPLANIDAARRLTEQLLAERRERLAALATDADAAVVLMGSFGRREVTSQSDEDYMVLFTGEALSHAKPTLEATAAALAGPAGPGGVFGAQVQLTDLMEIGLDDDTNHNLTRRMLLILESVAVSGQDAHARSRRALIERYLNAGARDFRPPRFFINDLVRYWRTIAVDFEGKMHARSGEGWGLRNAKLRLSRKALFAGGLLPLLECGHLQLAGMLDYLDERMSRPPLDRIADAFIAKNAIDPARRALGAYDSFLGILGNPEHRAELEQLAAADARSSELFCHVDDLGDQFQSGLLALLFDNEDFHEWVREYLIF